MKIPAILTCLLAVLLASVPVRQARADDVSFDVFYNNLADDGDWYNTPEYGYVWQPSIAYKSDKWRPYTDGYWAQTDDGWTWVSYENFGWATYHYGRWTRLKDLGWAWVPGYDWGPGWVSWRTSDDYVGWAPLPPKAEQGVYEGRVADQPRPRAEAINYNDVEPEDYGSDVDVNYDIGPENYCFVETRSFGAPVLSEVCLPPQRNVVIIERTVNVTNIYRRRGPDSVVVYNNGPDYNFISAHCERPIQQLHIERHNDLDFLRNGIHGGGNANQVRNGVFSVAAPPIARGPMNFAQVKPQRVKQTIERPEIDHGWSHAGGDPGTAQRLREQFKQQAQQAPPPRRDLAPLPARANEPARDAANQPPRPANTGAQPFNPPAGGPRQPLTDEEKAARRDAAVKARDARNNAPAAGQPAPPQPAADQDRGPRANKGPVYPTNNPPAANGQPATDEDKAARRARRQQEKAQQAGQQPPAGAQPVARPDQPAAAAPADEDKAARRARRQQEKAQQAGQAPGAAQPADHPAQPAAGAPPTAPADPDREARRLQRQQEKAQRTQQAAPDREPTRPEQPSRPAAPQPQPRAPQPDAQPEARNPAREARREARQEQAAPQPQPRAAQPEAPHRQPDSTPQGTPNGKKNQNQ